MLENLFPQPITNQYRGAAIAKWVFIALVTITKWVFIALVTITIFRSLAHILLPDGGAQSIATVSIVTLVALFLRQSKRDSCL